MKDILQKLRWVLLLPSGVALYLLAAGAGALIPGSTAERVGEPAVWVGLAAGPIHYDFLLPATAEVRETFAFAARAGIPVDEPRVEWLVVGWGAEAFYTTVGTYADVSLGATWKGITGDRSVMRVGAVGPVSSPRIEWIRLSQPEFEALVASIRADVAPGEPVLPVPTRPGSAYFASPGAFHLFRTCNVWVGEKLRAAGLRFGRWTPTTFAVRFSLGHFGHLAQGAGGPPP